MNLDNLVRRIEECSRTAPPQRSIVESIADYWSAFNTLEPGEASGQRLLDACLVHAASTDRPWLVGAAALQASIHFLLEGVAHELEGRPHEVASFCASEMGGNRPRAIETSLSKRPTGGYSMTGTKRWATLGPLASHLVIIASEGRDAERNHLRAVLVPVDRAGVFVEEMTIPGSMQASLRLPQALIQLEEVQVFEAELLPGDGYSHFLKPFRTIEDLFTTAARAACLVALGFRHASSAEDLEGLIALLASLRSLMHEELSSPSSHLVVSAAEAALPSYARGVVSCLPPEAAAWWGSEEEIAVAPTAKARRRQSALERILEG